LDLASALVKIARIIPLGARPTMPAGVFLFGDEETKGIKSRVRRLLALAATGCRPGSRYPVLAKLVVWGPTSMLFVSLAFAATDPYLLSSVHNLIERAVFVLR
jgi:hypothetical protein